MHIFHYSVKYYTLVEYMYIVYNQEMCLNNKYIRHNMMCLTKKTQEQTTVKIHQIKCYDGNHKRHCLLDETY